MGVMTLSASPASTLSGKVYGLTPYEEAEWA
jgi:hypothetical protein